MNRAILKVQFRLGTFEVIKVSVFSGLREKVAFPRGVLGLFSIFFPLFKHVRFYDLKPRFSYGNSRFSHWTQQDNFCRENPKEGSEKVPSRCLSRLVRVRKFQPELTSRFARQFENDKSNSLGSEPLGRNHSNKIFNNMNFNLGGILGAFKV